MKRIIYKIKKYCQTFILYSYIDMHLWKCSAYHAVKSTLSKLEQINGEAN